MNGGAGGEVDIGRVVLMRRSRPAQRSARRWPLGWRTRHGASRATLCTAHSDSIITAESAPFFSGPATRKEPIENPHGTAARPSNGSRRAPPAAKMLSFDRAAFDSSCVLHLRFKTRTKPGVENRGASAANGARLPSLLLPSTAKSSCLLPALEICAVAAAPAQATSGLVKWFIYVFIL